MCAVGVKVLKNKLSEYVRLAATGETVLVTDRDRVVAELGPPRQDACPPQSIVVGIEKRPAIVVSAASDQARRRDVVIMAVTSRMRTTATLGEFEVVEWTKAALILPSALGPAPGRSATIKAGVGSSSLSGSSASRKAPWPKTLSRPGASFSAGLQNVTAIVRHCIIMSRCFRQPRRDPSLYSESEEGKCRRRQSTWCCRESRLERACELYERPAA